MSAITFHQSGKERIVWNPATSKAGAEFIGGTFTTEDESVQKLLINLGYKTIEQVKAGIAEAALQMPYSRPAVPSTEAGGATAEAEDNIKRRDQTAFADTTAAEESNSPRPTVARNRPGAKANRRVQP